MKCDDYHLDRRGDIFDHLHKIWTDTPKNAKWDWDNDIWRKANTLQALVQFWSTADASNPRRAIAVDMMSEAYQFYVKYLKDHPRRSEIWVDDFGWWGGFFIDLYFLTGGQPPKPFDKVDLLQETQRCYDRMRANLDTTNGGIWNQTDDDGRKLPQSQKNTVTNAWMLNLASDLFVWTQNSDYKKMAEAQYNWLTTGNSTKNWALYTPNGLLWWLPGTANSERQCQQGGGPECQYWSGDEGVFLRGIAAYTGVDPTMKKELLSNSKKLIVAAITPTEDFSDENRNAWKGFPDDDKQNKQHVMHESPASDWTTSDLATGKGVFMRLVTRIAWQYNYFDDNEFEKTFKGLVNSSAESAWCSRDKTTGTIAPNWNPGFGPAQEGTAHDDALWPQVFQTNGLDALNAAVQIQA